MTRRYRAPTANHAVLAEPGFDAIPALVEANQKLLDRRDVVIGGLPLRELRTLARQEVLALTEGRCQPDAPLLLTGHQPELSHPGVWVKNFALNGLARRVGGVPLNLIVDNDTLKSTSLRFPVFRDHDPHSVRLESMAFDAFKREVPYEDRKIEDPVTFSSFPRRFAEHTPNWPDILLHRVWSQMPHSHLLGGRFAGLRRQMEREWGCDNLELPVSQLSQTKAFGRFASHILAHLPRFRAVYNAAILAYRNANGIRSKNHPAPELAEGEAPFWVRTTNGRREHATPTSDIRTLRPRALTLTLFARVCLGDFFIHGIGGGKYDEVTDSIIRDYFGVDSPAYQVLSATLHLPLPNFPSTSSDLHQAERRVRDLHWNPQRHLSADHRSNPKVKSLTESHVTLAANEPPYANHTARRAWFRSLREITEQLQPLVASRMPEVEAHLERVRSEARANEILQRRDYAWVLYPEEMLREFLQRFL